MDKIKPQSTFIKKNEILLKEDGKWLHFSEPHHIIIAEKLEEVLPALREIERRVRASGYYAAGFLSYEAASAFEPALRTRAERRSKTGDEAQDAGFPFLWFGLYSEPHVITLPKTVQPKEKLNWEPTIDRETYNAAIAQIKDHIAEGRTYQVNYTVRLRSEFTGNAWNFFLHLVRGQNNHAAFIDTGRYVICSASPELFFQLDGETITGRPMKGTTRRGRTTLEDQEQAQWLHESEKNRAENVMIVDMIRNDLGRIARVGSVKVPELFTVEKYPTLWQMTSTVTARTNASLTEIFTALFPCASITGAPKVSTMRIIAELETTPRRVYTGSIGYIAPNRKAKFNVAIRTALIDRETKTAEYGVGGGIVWDSTSADEYSEALLKARVLTEHTQTFSLLETMLWTPAEGFFLKEKHIARLLDSASYFDFPVSSQLRWLNRQRGLDTDFVHSTTAAVSKPPPSNEIIETYLNKISSQFTSPQRVRVILDKNGKLNYESKLFQPSEDHPPLKVCLAKEPIHSGNIFLYHKTTQRGVYESARKDFPDYDDVLLYNEKGELTEFTIGNLVVELDGRLFTPPLSCGLLPGTFRAHLLETGQVVERAILVKQLRDSAKIFRVNSIRKWQKVRIIG
ncbi:MAG TPA: aminodeoxychorismate synthase component I [Anaerolineales bacterium]|nr:aminodeoxychorismate synthase component I [Anaerolineales bacterium]